MWDEAKKACVALKESNKAFDLQLSAKQCAEVEECVHNTIKSNASSLTCSYTLGRFCGVALEEHHHNQVLSITWHNVRCEVAIP